MSFKLKNSNSGATCCYLDCDKPRILVAFDVESSLCKKHYLESKKRHDKRMKELDEEHDNFYASKGN